MYQWTRIIVSNPGTPGDVIRVHRKMTGNFKCGMNNMLSRSIDPVDSRYLQWRADDGHRSLRHVSVPDKPIREEGALRMCEHSGSRC